MAVNHLCKTPEKSPSPGGTGQEEAALPLPSLQKARGGAHQGVATYTKWSALRQPVYRLLLEDIGQPLLLPEQNPPTSSPIGKVLSVCQETRDAKIEVHGDGHGNSASIGDMTELHAILPQWRCDLTSTHPGTFWKTEFGLDRASAVRGPLFCFSGLPQASSQTPIFS